MMSKHCSLLSPSLLPPSFSISGQESRTRMFQKLQSLIHERLKMKFLGNKLIQLEFAAWIEKGRSPLLLQVLRFTVKVYFPSDLARFSSREVVVGVSPPLSPSVPGVMWEGTRCSLASSIIHVLGKKSRTCVCVPLPREGEGDTKRENIHHM